MSHRVSNRALAISIWGLVIVVFVVLAVLWGPIVTATAAQSPINGKVDLVFRLKTDHHDGKYVYVGLSESVLDSVNPVLRVPLGSRVRIELVNGHDDSHDIAVPAFQAYSNTLKHKDETTSITFTANRAGNFSYFCTIGAHKAAGMVGLLQVIDPHAHSSAGHGSMVMDHGTETGDGWVSRDPYDVPKAAIPSGPRRVLVRLEAREMTASFDEGKTYHFFTYNGKVPGPFVRARVGDTIVVQLVNPRENENTHSVDFHAAMGPGGGGSATQAEPGQERRFEFLATKPGLFVYHCATPMVAHHIANGMFGMILIEPQGGLPPVDQELYIMQSELYTNMTYLDFGDFSFDMDKMMAETPDFYLFNGAVGAVGKIHPVRGKVGDRIRIYFGDAGPNAGSSIHLVGAIMDKVYPGGSFAQSQRDLQTLFVPPGSAAVLEYHFEVPGSYMLMDHALSREARGASGMIQISGPDNPHLFRTLEGSK